MSQPRNGVEGDGVSHAAASPRHSELRIDGRDSRWVLPAVREADEMQLAAALRCSRLLARVLLARGHDAASARAYLTGDESLLRQELDDVEPACRRIEAAIDRNEPILIHGDYDVDGITAAVILRHTLDRLGARAKVFLPHRIEDGYGVSMRAVSQAVNDGARLFITADCGASAAEALAALQKAGCDSIVADHHVQDAPVEAAVAVLNPVKPGSRYPDRDLAAVGVAYKLALRLLDRKQLPVPALLHAVAAIGTVGDVAPLRGENREIVRKGLRAIADCGNPGLLGLLHKAQVNVARVRAWNIAFQIGPRLNAAGRLDHPRKAFDLFFERDPERLRVMLEEIEELNRRRQAIEGRLAEEALSLADPQAAVLTLDGEGWDRGVIGIVASRLVERFHRPVLVISRQGEAAYGSARSVPGVNIVELLRGASGELAAFGGHELAAGFSLSSDRIRALRERLETAVSLLGERPAPELRLDAELCWQDLGFRQAEELAKMEPFGHGNPEPLFYIRSVIISQTPRRVGENGLRTMVRLGNRNIAAIAWRKPGWEGQMATEGPVDLAARLRVSEYQGLRELELQLEDFRSAGE
ncbi:MAG: single-stranded-DNA-specific exonuclease RecJ [Acidobacteriota bacterium]